MEKAKKYDIRRKTRIRKICFYTSIVFNLGLLFGFKYLDMAIATINKILLLGNFKLIESSFDLLLPVGISFYTFQAIGYTIDVYRDENFKVEKHFGKYALFVSFFPQLVAGPIERSGNLLSQFYEKHYFEYERVKRGLLLMLWGLFQKIVIADRVAVIVNEVYNNYTAYTGIVIVIATMLFAVQIYCDFGGYSNIAIGASRVMGYDLMSNFKQPYFSLSIKEFWHRWHISLSTWFRDYVYIPLGGSRVSEGKKIRNVLITFFISGLWHGASWNYVIWGVLHGLYQIIGDLLKPLKDLILRILKIDKSSFGHKAFQLVCTFSLVSFAWIFFRAASAKEALLIIRNMFSDLNIQALWNGQLYNLGFTVNEFNFMLLSIGILLTGDILSGKLSIIDNLNKQHLIFRWLVYLLIIYFIIGVLLMQGFGNTSQEFIYFQF